MHTSQGIMIAVGPWSWAGAAVAVVLFIFSLHHHHSSHGGNKRKIFQKQKLSLDYKVKRP